MCKIPHENGQYYLAGVLAAKDNHVTIFGDVIANIEWIMDEMQRINDLYGGNQGRRSSGNPLQDAVEEDIMEDLVEDVTIDWKTEVIMKQERKISMLLKKIRELASRKCKLHPIYGK